MQKLYLPTLIILIIFLGIECQTTLRDEVTLSTIDELQVMTIKLYQSFAVTEYKENQAEQDQRIQRLKIRFHEARRYETEKQRKTKKDNRYTLNQFKTMMSMISRHIKDYKSANIWTETHKNNVIENVKKAFRIMRESERDKKVKDDFLGKVGM